MSKNKTAEQSGEVAAQPDNGLAAKVRGLDQRVNAIESFLRMVSGFGADLRSGAEVLACKHKGGGVRLMACVALFGVLALAVQAATTLWSVSDGSAIHGTAKVVSDGAGAATLTVDKAVIGAYTATTTNLTVTTLTASGNVSVGGTLGVTGVATFTGNALANELDTRTATPLLLGKATATGVTVGAADAHTTIAGNLLASDVDAATAATLLLGKATATKVEIADTAVTTEVQGPLVAKEDIQSDEIDAETATALLLGKATATSVTIGAADAHTTIAGNLLASDVDAATAATLLLGKATATKVEIADTAVETEIQGPLDAQEAATFASTVGVTGATTLGAGLILTPGTISNAAGIHTQTVTKASYLLAASAVNTQRFANGTAGQIVFIKNNAATNVVLDVGAGKTLEDNETAIIGYLGAEWVLFATTGE
jgi:hypothetical protein